MEPELDRRLLGIEDGQKNLDGKVDAILVLIPRFVTWSGLGRAVLGVATVVGVIVAVVVAL